MKIFYYLAGVTFSLLLSLVLANVSVVVAVNLLDLWQISIPELRDIFNQFSIRFGDWLDFAWMLGYFFAALYLLIFLWLTVKLKPRILG